MVSSKYTDTALLEKRFIVFYVCRLLSMGLNVVVEEFYSKSPSLDEVLVMYHHRENVFHGVELVRSYQLAIKNKYVSMCTLLGLITIYITSLGLRCT